MSFLKGLDTETYQGYAKLAATPTDYWYSETFATSDPSWLDWFLAQIDQPKPLQYCHWNLRFDISSLIKHLGPDAVRRLLYFNTLDYTTPGDEEVRLSLIPWKLFRIEWLNPDPNSKLTNQVEFYDAAQFYHTSLEDAARSVLGKGKVEERAFAESLNKTRKPWREDFSRVLFYCRTDADLTGELMHTFLSGVASLGINIKRPLSCAFLAGEAVKTVCPTWLRKSKNYRWHERYDRVGLQAYFGGRFEVIKKGYFEQASIFDIRSAYPYYTQNLPQPGDVSFEYQALQTYTGMEDYPPGTLIRASVTIPTSYNIGLLPVKLGKDNIWPVGEIAKSWFHHVELQEASKWPGVVIQPDLALVSQIEGGKDYHRPLADLVGNLYQSKEDWKLVNDPRHMAAKVIPNSIYGKLLQLTEVVEEDPEGTTEFDGRFYQKLRKRAGKFYLPLFAGYITAGTRAQILEFVRTHNLTKHLIGFATDSVTFEGTLPRESENFLGGWGLEKGSPGSLTMIRSGVYEIGGKLKTRGIRNSGIHKDPTPLRDRIRETSQGLVVRGTNRGPIHLPNTLRSKKYQFKDALTWIEEPRDMNVTLDPKREWPTFTKIDLLEGQISSKPKTLQGTLHHGA